MEIYDVVLHSTNVPRFVAQEGWEVYASLGAALRELEDRLRSDIRTPNLAKFEKTLTVIKHEIPLRYFFEGCRCGVGSVCLHNGWVRIDELLQLRLMRTLRGWNRVTQEDYVAWSVNERMTKGSFDPWVFEARWFPFLALSEEPPKPRMMVPSFKRR